MPNPFFSNKTSPNGATAPNDSLNESSKRYFRGYNKFNLTRQFYNTERYADINLIEVVEGVEGDKLSFANKHFIRSYTLKSPIMFDIYKKKTYFAVNNLAILPNTWKLIYKQPNKGDDVPDDANCVVNFIDFFRNLFLKYKNSQQEDSDVTYNYNWHMLFLLESIFSSGSLLASMNCHLSTMIRSTYGSIPHSNFDSFIEEVFSDLSTSAFDVYFPSIDYTLSVSASNFRIALDMMRTFSDWTVSFDPNSQDILFNALSSLQISYEDLDIDGDSELINLSRLIAYQLVCCQFYTRDSVDNVYTAEMYLDNAKSVFADFGENFYFTYNGSEIEYDVFSGIRINYVFDYLLTNFNDGIHSSAFQFLHLIFGIRKSLRYGDYFVGAKTLPYAPMDVTADVVGSGVSALDITRSIIAQRFANAVERVSNTWKDYLSGITGGVASPNPYEPRFLASSTSSVNGFEVENTAESQFTNNNITTILKSGNSNYVYEVEVSEPCIIIGVSTYEVPRVYSTTVSRFFKHTDRFNMFNKFFQNIGDQEITQNERNASFSPLKIFGYTPRHMEYKQRFPIAAGGFVNNLPGYSFITDNNTEMSDLENNLDLKISPYYIRNKNYEFDRFYASLTGFSLASYFHFIVKYDNICRATRQMEYSPSIL